MEIPRFRWRSRDELIQELDARVKIKDIKEIYDLKDALAVKWWEPLVKLLVFVSAVGFILTFAYFLQTGTELVASASERAREPGVSIESARVIFWIIIGWFFVLIVAGLGSLELLLLKFQAMRRLHEIQLRIIEHLQGEMEQLLVAKRQEPGAGRQGNESIGKSE